MALPRLELPPDALVLFESVPAGSDRSGAYRFAVTHDGRFLHSGNPKLDDADPEPFWTTPLEHLATFDSATVQAIGRAADDVSQLPEAIRTPPGNESSPTLERITVSTTGDDPHSHTTIANARARPPQVTKLLEIVDRAGKDQG